MRLCAHAPAWFVFSSRVGCCVRRAGLLERCRCAKGGDAPNCDEGDAPNCDVCYTQHARTPILNHTHPHTHIPTLPNAADRRWQHTILPLRRRLFLKARTRRQVPPPSLSLHYLFCSCFCFVCQAVSPCFTIKKTPSSSSSFLSLSLSLSSLSSSSSSVYLSPLHKTEA